MGVLGVCVGGGGVSLGQCQRFYQFRKVLALFLEVVRTSFLEKVEGEGCME